MTNVAQDPEQRVKNIENIESDSLRARQKTLASFIRARLLAILAKSDNYADSSLSITYDGDTIRVVYRPPRGWRHHMKGEQYCPPKAKQDKIGQNSQSGQRQNARRGVTPRFDYDRHYLYGN